MGFEYQPVQRHADSWGYHAGGSLSVFVTRAIGLGVNIRYARADVEVLNNFGSTRTTAVQRIKAGGLHAIVGSHIRF